MNRPPQKPLLEPVAPRSIGWLVGLCVVTLGFYGFYLIYAWAKELNQILGTAKYRPGLMLLISIVTCGVGALFIEYLYACELEKDAARQGRMLEVPNLPTLVIGLNIAALVFSLLPGAVFVVSIPLGITASALLQQQINRLCCPTVG